MILAALLGFVLAGGGPALFIVTQCYGNGTQPAVALPEAARDLPNITRAEAFTYLTLPEWFIVYSGDEYATVHCGPNPERVSLLPLRRPVLGRLSLRLPDHASASTLRDGYHVMLGVIGASFTVESVHQGLYEGTIGRLVTDGWRTRHT